MAAEERTPRGLADWTPAARAVWGKTNPAEGASLPLVQHLEDTRLVAGHLWDTWLPPIFKARVSAAAGTDEEAGRRLLTWLAAIHDCGKATPSFAAMAYDIGMDHILRPLTDLGVAAPHVSRTQRRHHPLTGQVAVERWLHETHEFRPRRARQIGGIVGGHHGLPQSYGMHEDASIRLDDHSPAGTFGTPAWAAIRHEILQVMTHRCVVETALEHVRDLGLPLEVQMDLTAAVIVSDWIASDEAVFPYDDLSDPRQRWAEGRDRIDVTPPWRPTVSGEAPTLGERFPHLGDVPAHPLQRAATDAADEATSPPMLIVEAAMGGGKTEAALLAAERLAGRWGCGGMYVGLPTMATSDAMFARVLRWLDHVPVEQPSSVYLAHSKADLNDTYRGLVGRAFRARSVFDDESRAAARRSPVVSLWTTGRKKGVLANQVVGTIDQVLFMGLQTKHLALRHLAMSTKVVIVDEVHAADEYMRSYLCRVLVWLGRYRTPVILMSATLPGHQREQLVRAYLSGRSGKGPAADRPVPVASGYPRITVVSDEVSVVPVAAPTSSTAVSLEVQAGESDAVADRVLDELAEGGCGVVVCNTVGRAQAVYEALASQLLQHELLLVHSRFIGPDRMALEARLRAALGPRHEGSVHRPQRMVVVGTQVLEQSLDIDADVMLSDIAPVDLLLQRAGRLHRHHRPESERPARLRLPRLVVTGMDLGKGGGAPRLDRGACAVYGRYRLLRAVEALQLWHGDPPPVELPEDIPDLVERAYDPTVASPEGWTDEWERARTAWERQVEQSLGRATVFQLPHVDYQRDLVDLLPAAVPAEGDDLARGVAQVRDSADSLEVVLVAREGGGQVRVLPGDFSGAGRVLPTVLGPEDDLAARAAASSTVRLPLQLSNPGTIDRVIETLESEPLVAGWQQNRWLRGQLVVVLGEDLTTSLCGYAVRYDRVRGLIVEPERVAE